MVATRQRGRTLILRPGRDSRLPDFHGRANRWFGLAAVFLLGATAVIPLLSRAINPYDEGMVAYGAGQVLRGQRPAVDFYSPYGPGVFYLIAGAYQLFGTRLLVERWVAGMLLVATGVLGYLLLITRPPAERGYDESREDPIGTSGAGAGAGSAGWRSISISATAGLLIVLMLVSGWWYTPVNGGSLVLLLLSGLLLQRGLALASPGWAAAAGAVAGVALLWRLAFGGALLIASGLTWALTTSGSPAGRRREAAPGLMAMFAAAAAVALPVYAGLIHASGDRALKSLLVWPLTSTGAADLSWPAFSGSAPYTDMGWLSQMAAATYGAGFYYGITALALVLWRLPLRSLPLADRRLGLWLLLMLPPLFLYAHGRTDYLHVTPLLVFSLLLAALALDSALSVPSSLPTTSQTTPSSQNPDAAAGQRRRLSWSAALARRFSTLRLNPLPFAPSLPRRPSLTLFWQALGLLAWVASVLLLLPTIAYSWIQIRNSAGRTPLELPGPRGAGVYAPFRYSRQYRVLVPQIHQYVAPSQTIFSGTRQHDVYLTNDILLYFLADRNAATYYWCLDAGVTSSAPVQEEMLAELARGGVAAAVIWQAPTIAEKNKGGKSSGVTLLDDWLNREFDTQHIPGLQYDLRLRKAIWTPR